jgi:predicted enzyme related to lactoylglutathione lyase
MKNAINWFEIPVTNLDNAVRFYESLLDQKLQRQVFDGEPLAMFDADKQAVTGALIPAGKYGQPGSNGTVIYFDARDLAASLKRAVDGGGKVVTPVTAIGPHGHIAVVLDPDGNKVGLHTPPATA